MTIYLTVDLGYGDAGKGSIVDYLARVFESPLVVRYNGGCQAAHNVVLPDGRHHTFSQIGSGAFAGADTFLSRYVAVAPDNFIIEDDHIRKVLKLNRGIVYVDGRAPIVTPVHRMANQLRESKRYPDDRHGSCGQGIGELMADRIEYKDANTIFVRDLLGKSFDEIKAKLKEITKNKWYELGSSYFHEEASDFLQDPPLDQILEFYSDFASRVVIVDDDWLSNNLPDGAIFEGSQGVLLDPRYGKFPHVTHGNTTLEQANVLLNEVGICDVYSIGITRAYATRHGAGPLEYELDSDILKLDGEHNGEDRWQGKFRVGIFNMDSIMFAASVCPIDSLAITCMDHVNRPWPYYYKGERNLEKGGILAAIARVTGIPVSIASFGPTHQEKSIEIQTRLDRDTEA